MCAGTILRIDHFFFPVYDALLSSVRLLSSVCSTFLYKIRSFLCVLRFAQLRHTNPIFLPFFSRSGTLTEDRVILNMLGQSYLRLLQKGSFRSNVQGGTRV